METKDDLQMQLDLPDKHEDYGEQGTFREGIIFLIDARDLMFQVDPDREMNYISQSLQVYKNILRQKLSWNKSDFMGIILIGTNKSDTNPKIDHILTIQKFEQVSIDQLKEIEHILDNLNEFQEEIGSSTTFPLANALWQAARSLSMLKPKIPFRRVILFTCSDNPCENRNIEKHEIRIKAKDYSDSGIRFTVVGLGKNWNPNHFYKDLEISSRKFDQGDDYQRTYLVDIEEQIKHPSRASGKLPWRLGNEVEFGVSCYSVTAKTQFPAKASLNEKTNELLDTYTFYQKVDTDLEVQTQLELIPNEDDADESNPSQSDFQNCLLAKDVSQYRQYGGKKIIFTSPEAYGIANTRQPGIDLLGFKPLNCLDITYHIEPPKFISYDESELRGSKRLFAALLKQCDSKKVMAITAITFRARSAACIYAMIPNMSLDGFYAYKQPFRENVKDLNEQIPNYVYDESDDPCPIEADKVKLWTEFLKKSTIDYNPTMFLNPRLHIELANIESLAMDRSSRELPDDTTVPDKQAVQARLASIGNKIQQLVIETRGTNEKSTKTSSQWNNNVPKKIAKMDGPLDFDELVRTNRVDKCTVIQLKDYLLSVDMKPSGKKSDLVNMVYSYHKNKGS